VNYSIYALLDDDMLQAFGFPKPLPLTRPMIRADLKLRGAFIRWLPPRRQPHFFTDNPNLTHPKRYEIHKLGPPKLVASEERAEAQAGKPD